MFEPNYTKYVTRITYLGNGIMMKCSIPVPDVDNLNEGRALGESRMERSENLHRLVETMFEPQYVRAAKNIVSIYKESELPISYIQNITIHVLPMGLELSGGYEPFGDTVYMDSNASCGMDRFGSGEFIFGHEIGHKVILIKTRERMANIERAYDELDSLLFGVLKSGFDDTAETACDFFGSLLDRDKIFLFDEGRIREIQRKILYIAHC